MIEKCYNELNEDEKRILIFRIRARFAAQEQQGWPHKEFSELAAEGHFARWHYRRERLAVDAKRMAASEQRSSRDEARKFNVLCVEAHQEPSVARERRTAMGSWLPSHQSKEQPRQCRVTPGTAGAAGDKEHAVPNPRDLSPTSLTLSTAPDRDLIFHEVPIDYVLV